MRVLLTGGAGYIGSHTCVELLSVGHEVVIVDTLENSSEEVLKRLAALTGKKIPFYRIDVRDRAALKVVFDECKIDAAVHFAGLKAVGESVEQPLRYYDYNMGTSVALCHEMSSHGVFNLVFSSSATVYADPGAHPIPETAVLGSQTPYGRTKLYQEELFRDLSHADNRWNIALLRYFNPVGAHKSGQIGEDPTGIPNNLMPFISQVAAGKREYLNIFGSDYNTPDGTAIRDYIHVVDLALGHVRALEFLSDTAKDGVSKQTPIAVNLGTGVGHSVLEMATTFQAESGQDVPYRLTERRQGDAAACVADPSLAATVLGWRAKREIGEMVRDTWRWQSQNPSGFTKSG